MESINCIVETPKNCGAKYTYDQQQARVELTKILPAGLVFPFDFGFIPGTIGEDGDPLDVIILSEIPTFPGCLVKCRIIGGIKAMQKEKDGERIRNDRFLAIPAASVLYRDVKNSSQLPDKLLDELQQFFINYNQQAGKKFMPLQLIKTAAALKIIKAATEKALPAKLIQLLLPLYGQQQQKLPAKLFAEVKKTLVKKFGGVTMYVHKPAVGLWEDDRKNVARDEIVVYEVMAPAIDRSFWKEYKATLEKLFRQKELVIRQIEIGVL